MVGIVKRYDAELPMNAVEVWGIPVISMGIVEGDSIITNSVCAYEAEKRIYRKIVLQNKKIVGMVFVGDVRKAGIILSLIKKGEDVSFIKHELLDGELLAYSPITPKLRHLLYYPK